MTKEEEEITDELMQIIEKPIECRLEEHSNSGKFIYPTEVFKRDLLEKVMQWHISQRKAWARGIVPVMGSEDCNNFVEGWADGWNDCCESVLKSIEDSK